MKRIAARTLVSGVVLAAAVCGLGGAGNSSAQLLPHAKGPMPAEFGHVARDCPDDNKLYAEGNPQGVNACVKAIQGDLNGYPGIVGLKNDGKYGPDTKAAVVRFQQTPDLHLKQDGIVGPETLRALKKVEKETCQDRTQMNGGTQGCVP